MSTPQMLMRREKNTKDLLLTLSYFIQLNYFSSLRMQIYWFAVQSIFTECFIFDFYFFFLLFLVDIVQPFSS
jgi:hypothetical protein